MQDLDLKTIHEWPMSAQSIVVALMVILILIFGYFFDLKPYQTQMSSSRQQEVDLRRQLASLLDKQANIKEAVDKLPGLKKTLDGWQKNVVTESELPALLDTLLRLGKSNQLKILNFQPERVSKDGIYHKVPVNIDVVGTYDQIANYISDIANMDQFVIVDTYFIYDKTPNEASSNGQFPGLTSDEILSAEIDIEIYRR